MRLFTGEEGALPRVKPFKYTYEKEIVMYAFFKKLDYFSTECIYAPYAARGAAREFVKDLEVRAQLPLPRLCYRCAPNVMRSKAPSGEELVVWQIPMMSCAAHLEVWFILLVCGCAAEACAAPPSESSGPCCASCKRCSRLPDEACGVQQVRPRAICDLIKSAEQFRLDVKAGGNLPVPGKCQRCGYISSQDVCKACILLEGLNRGMPTLGISRTRTKKAPRTPQAVQPGAAVGHV